MGKNKELAEYIMDQLAELGDIRNIPMMGGYVFYYRERIFGGIYGNGFLVKITEASKKYMPDSVPEPPYEGAKPMLPVTIWKKGTLYRQWCGRCTRNCRRESQKRRTKDDGMEKSADDNPPERRGAGS